MGRYYLYKDEQLINIIKADEGFIKQLLEDGSIDEAIDESTIEKPISLQFNEEKKVFEESPKVIPIEVEIDNKPKISIEEMKMDLDKLKEQNAKLEERVYQQINDIQSAFLSVKGFLLMIPEVQKTLSEINEKLDDKKDQTVL